MFKKCLIIIVTSVFITTTGSAFSGLPGTSADGKIKGEVVDMYTGKKLNGVSVEIVNTNRRSITKTCPHGKFRFGALEPGVYRIIVHSAGYEKLYKLMWVAGDEMTVTFRLAPPATH